jgi:predicted membrane-bound spermidine synthase
MEHRTNFNFVYEAEGDVLVAGLGIGYVLLPVLRAREVESVTVVELHQDVIDLVEPHLRVAVGAAASKLTVVQADIFDFEPAKGQKWDVIYFDIWPDRCTDNLEQMAKLHRRFARRKRRWMNSWCRDELKREQRAWNRERADYNALTKILNPRS